MVTSLVVKSEKKSVNSTVAETEFMNEMNIINDTAISLVTFFIPNTYNPHDKYFSGYQVFWCYQNHLEIVFHTVMIRLII